MTAQFRWTTIQRKRPALGTRRLNSRMLWLPMRIGDDVRWFGVESFYEEYSQYRIATTAGTRTVSGWLAVEWLNP